MRRTELLNAVLNLKHRIDQLNLLKLFNEMGRAQGDKDVSPTLLEALRQWSIYVHNATEAEKTVIKTFDLDSLANAQVWHDLATGDPPKRIQLARHLFRSLQLVHEFLEPVIRLIEPEAGKILDSTPERKSGNILSVLL